MKDGVPAAKYESIARAVKDVVSANHGLALSCVCLLKTRSVPKTTSGKIARSWCRRAFQEKTLQVLYRLDSSEGDLAAATAAVIAGGDDSGADSPQVGQAGQAVGGGEGKGYSKLGTEEPDPAAASAAPPVHVAGPTHTPEEVRQLPLSEIAAQLESLLLQVAQQGPSPLSAPIDRKTPVSALGLDSMTLVQFKGVLEKRFHCDIPDDFLFTSQATLEQLALAVRAGKLTDEQRAIYEDTAQERAQPAENDPNGSTTVIAQSYKQPCCPWFTCCW